MEKTRILIPYILISAIILLTYGCETLKHKCREIADVLCEETL